MQQIRISKEVPGPPEAAWELFTDHAGWARWAGAKEVVVRQEGDPAPNGLGAICVLRASGLAIEEEVTAFDAPRRIAYRLVAGLPTRDHSGEVRFEACEVGTRLVWSVEFRPLAPGTGWLVEWGLRRSLAAVLARFSRELETARAT
ncbi:MAG: SRPBCC family protein [Myxococcota bacterium]